MVLPTKPYRFDEILKQMERIAPLAGGRGKREGVKCLTREPAVTLVVPSQPIPSSRDVECWLVCDYQLHAST